MKPVLKIIIASTVLVVAGAVCLELNYAQVGPVLILLGGVGIIVAPLLAEMLE